MDRPGQPDGRLGGRMTPLALCLSGWWLWLLIPLACIGAAVLGRIAGSFLAGLLSPPPSRQPTAEADLDRYLESRSLDRGPGGTS